MFFILIWFMLILKYKNNNVYVNVLFILIWLDVLLYFMSICFIFIHINYVNMLSILIRLIRGLCFILNQFVFICYSCYVYVWLNFMSILIIYTYCHIILHINLIDFKMHYSCMSNLYWYVIYDYVQFQSTWFIRETKFTLN